MYTLKFTKWLGLTLLCVAILSAPLAQIGLQAVRNLQDKPSQLELIQETGEQIDMIDSPYQLVNAAPADGEYEYLPAGTAKTLDPTGAGRIVGAFTNLADGEYEYVPAGGAKMIDPSGRIPGSALAAYNPADGEYEYVPAGGAKMIDPSGRIQGIAPIDPTNRSARIQAGGIAGIDPTNGSVRIQAGTAGSDKDDDNSYVLTTVIKDRRPIHKRK